jgi:hypothetical protein
MIIQILLFVTWLVFFIWLAGTLPFLKHSGIRPRILRAILILKILSGIALTLIYSFYYEDRQTADIYKYYDDARVIHATLQDDPLVYFSLLSGIEFSGHGTEAAIREMQNWTPLSGPWLRFTQTADYNLFNSNRIITRINALLMPLSQEFIYTHVIFFCFFSLLGLTALFKQVQAQVRNREVIAILLIFLLPSVLLWCSGLLKDGLLLALVNLFFWQLFQLRNKRTGISRLPGIVLLAFAGGLILFTKYYVLLAAVPAILAFIWSSFIRNRQRIALIYMAVPMVLFTMLIMQGEMDHQRPDLWSVLANKREEALKLAIWAEARHQVFTDPVQPGILPVLAKAPEAIFNSIFRPFIGEGGGVLIVLASLENLLIILLLILFLRKIDFGLFSNESVMFFLSYSIFLAFIIGFTTPVTGGLVRYKTAFIIYLLLAALMSGRYSGLQKFKGVFLQ